MAETLPAIDIAIRDDPILFLDRIIASGIESDDFEIDRSGCPTGDRHMEIVNFRLRAESSHEGHGFQLILHDDRPHRIEVEVRAQFWTPDPPTTAIYVDAAGATAGKLLRQYNRKYGTKYRLRIKRSSTPPFRMTQRTQTLLTLFTVSANMRSLHFNDWQRFYAIAREGRQEIPEQLFRSSLVKAGFAQDRSAELTEIYAHLCAFKRLK
jgi:hypothetical protein